MKSLSGSFYDCSRKDLVAVSRVLNQVLKKKGLEAAIKLFENYVKNGQYIQYTKNTTGLGHHGKLRSCRRPIKCYKYVISSLKGFRGSVTYLKELLKIQDESKLFDSVLVNTSTKRNPKGVIRSSRGRASKKDSRLNRIVLQVVDRI